jgi:hypothetical protein
VNVNDRYQLKLKVFEKLDFWVSDPLGLGFFRNAHLNRRMTPVWEWKMTQAHKLQYPRRRIIKFENVDEDTCAAIDEEVLALGMVYYEDRLWTHARLKRELRELAPQLDFTPYEDGAMYKVYRSETSAYRSQTNSYGYAKAPADRRKDLLIKHGFKAKVVVITWEDEFGPGETRVAGWTGNGYMRNYANMTYAFDVWANCEPYHLDAIQRMGGQTILEWAVDCWKRGTNPKVFNPFLSQEIYDKSMRIHMGKEVA